MASIRRVCVTLAWPVMPCHARRCIVVGIVYLVLSLLGTLPHNRYDVWGYLPYFNAFNNFFGALILLRMPGACPRPRPQS
jgi:hypothetical protein